MKKFLPLVATFLSIVLGSLNVYSQSPGIIIRPAGGPYSTVLDPNQDGFTSVSNSGFSGGDVGASYSEIPYKIVPPTVVEPTGDLATGPSGGFTDIVKTVDNSGFYIYNNGTNLLFRLRIGSVISGSKGYSILFDTDGKMGSSGPNADPNYIAPTNSSNGNPGFEYEVVLETNFRVAVYNVDGTRSPSLVTSYSLATNSQISVALSTDSGNPDFFYDFTVPITAIGSPASFRMVATTVTSPSSALQGSRSDIYGIDDAAAGGVPTAWQTVINSQPPVTPTDLTSGGSGPGLTCTAAPLINSPINTGSNISVGGSWTRMDASKPSSATITLYKNGVTTGTTSVSSGNNWSFVVATVGSGDVFYAKAQATGESMCLQSSSITAGCSAIPTAPVLTCASSKGISGTIPSGSTILIYQLPTTTASPTSIPLTTNITYPTPTTFAFYSNNCSGPPNSVANGSYMLMASNGGCISQPIFECISSASSGLTGLAINSALTLTTPIYPFHTTINGTGAANGNILRLFINGIYSSVITATGSGFSFTGLSLKSGDQLKIYSYTGVTCMTVSNTFTVSCYEQPPLITVTNGQLLSTATSVSGTSGHPGATVNLYRGTSPSGVSVGSTTTNGSGNWTVSPLTLTAGENYYATITSGGCTSASSSSAGVLAPTTVCPVITGNYTETSSSVSGTLPSPFTGTVHLYLDGSAIGAVSVTGATTWTINSPFTYQLYPGGILTVTAQASGAAESSGCPSQATIGCTSPSTPVVSPTSRTITAGQTATFNVSSATAGSWYALLDNNGVSYATSIYKTNTTTFNLVTKAFNGTGTYNLNLSANKLDGCAASYQSVVVIVSTSLPAILTLFKGSLVNDNVKLVWTTSSEQNVSHFEIEKSTDGIGFTAIATVAAAGNSSTTLTYEYTDNNPGSGKLYYRLKIADLDGNIKYSDIVTIVVNNTIITTVKPNPFTNELSISLSLENKDLISYALNDIAGRSVFIGKAEGRKGINVFNISGLDKIPAGVYVLRIKVGNRSQQQKLVKLANN